MSKPKMTILNTIHDEAALILLGARRIGAIHDETGALIGQEVEPAISMAAYPDALAEVEAGRLAARWAALRAERTLRLSASDWTQLPDAGLSDKARAGWAAYRRALRDLPALTEDPAAPAWPDPPA